MTDPAFELANRMGPAMLEAFWEALAALPENLIVVTADMMPSETVAKGRFGAFPDTPDPLTKMDLAQSGFVVEPVSGGRQRVHLLLSGFGVGKNDLSPQHVFLLNLLRLPKALSLGFRIERVLGGASQTGPETAGRTTPANTALAVERAATVSSWLIFELGLNDQRTRVVSYGSKEPLIDRTGHPDGLEDPLNRNVIITWSTEVRKPGPEPEPAPVEPPKTPAACPSGKSSHWALNQVGEIGLDITIPIPIAPAVGVGRGAALRLYKLDKLDDAGTTLASREFIAIGGGSVIDVDPLAFEKEAGQIADIVEAVRKIWKSASLGAAMTTVSRSTRFVNPGAYLGLNVCLDFDDWDPTLMLTQSGGLSGFGMTGGAELGLLPILTRANAGVNYDVGFAFAPNAGVKRFGWLLFAAPD